MKVNNSIKFIVSVILLITFVSIVYATHLEDVIITTCLLPVPIIGPLQLNRFLHMFAGFI